MEKNADLKRESMRMEGEEKNNTNKSNAIQYNRNTIPLNPVTFASSRLTASLYNETADSVSPASFHIQFNTIQRKEIAKLNPIQSNSNSHQTKKQSNAMQCNTEKQGVQGSFVEVLSRGGVDFARTIHKLSRLLQHPAQ